MKSSEMNRRDFTRWTAAAFGGVVAGSIAGCANQGETPPADSSTTPESTDGADEKGAVEREGSGAAAAETKGDVHDVAFLMEGPHVCRGLNMCKGKGAGGENACAGQGACATAEKHTCHTLNACKGQGGCGEHAGTNSCRGQGECGVPVTNKVSWETARKAFEEGMKAAGKEVGAAPAAPDAA